MAAVADPKSKTVAEVVAMLDASGTGAEKLAELRACATVDEMFDVPQRAWAGVNERAARELPADFFDGRHEVTLLKVWRLMQGLPLASNYREKLVNGQTIRVLNREQLADTMNKFRAWKMQRSARLAAAELEVAAK